MCVIDSREHTPGIKRRRHECNSCKGRFSTWESFNRISDVVDIRLKLQKLAEQAREIADAADASAGGVNEEVR